MGRQLNEAVRRKEEVQRHKDVPVIDVQPTASSTGQGVAQQLNEAVKKAGTPGQVVRQK